MLNLIKPKSWAVATLALATGAAVFSSCKKDDDNVSALTVSSIKASGRDLNGSTPIQDVPLASNVVVRFNKAVSVATATSANLSLVDSKNMAVPATVTAAGDSVVVNPTNDFMLGSNYTLKVGTGLKSNDGGALATELTRSFKVYGPANVDPPQSGTQTAYWNFNNQVNATAGAFSVSYSKNTFGTDRFGFENSCAYFNGIDDIIEVDNGRALITPKTTMSFWVKFDTTNQNPVKQGDFVMGLNLSRGFLVEFFGGQDGLKQAASFANLNGAVPDTGADDLFTNGSGEFAGNGSFVGWEFAKKYPVESGGIKAIIKDKWLHFISTYDQSTKRWTLYLNGEKAKVVNYGNYPTGDLRINTTGYAPRKGSQFSDKLAFGFGQARDSRFDTVNPDGTLNYGNFAKPDNNHFKGWLDDVRFLNATFSDADALALYNAERVK